MNRKMWSKAVALGTLVVMMGCSEAPPFAPSEAMDVGARGANGLASTATSTSVTLLPDLTASPSRITVPAGSRLLVKNSSGRSTRLHSYNCSEFSLMSLPDGYSKNTYPFSPAGKTCDYFAWDTNWSRKIFVGQVVVQ